MELVFTVDLHKMWDKCMKLSFICPPNPLMECIIMQQSGFTTNAFAN